MALNQTILQHIKKFFEYVHFDVKCIEFHLPHYDIPQLSFVPSVGHVTCTFSKPSPDQSTKIRLSFKYLPL